jgi:hypothetical protein
MDIVRLLLDNGSEVNDLGGVRSEALYRAISNGHTAIADLLHARGAKPSKQ